MNDRLLQALWVVRHGGRYDYVDGIHFGIVLGMAGALTFDQHHRINTLLLNASDHARKDWERRSTEAQP